MFNDLLPREQREAEGDLKIAQAELALAEEQRDAKKLVGGADQLEVKLSELAIARAKLALEKAGNRLHVLGHYTKDKQTRELATHLESSRSTELAKKATWELEKSKEKKLERQIAACTFKAPIDGTLVYYGNSPGRQPAIEEGATVGAHSFSSRSSLTRRGRQRARRNDATSLSAIARKQTTSATLVPIPTRRTSEGMSAGSSLGRS